jgi:hypothetical protein
MYICIIFYCIAEFECVFLKDTHISGPNLDQILHTSRFRPGSGLRLGFDLKLPLEVPHLYFYDNYRKSLVGAGSLCFGAGAR